MTQTTPHKAAALHKLSVVIPAKNAGATIRRTVESLHEELLRTSVPHEILVVVDSLSEDTWTVLLALCREIPGLRPIHNTGPQGFGSAVRFALERISGDAVVIMMADGSDSSADVVRYWLKLNEGYDCVFGSRFVRGGKAVGYPRAKLVLNRAANYLIMLLFGTRFNDMTNAFKAYRSDVIRASGPFVSQHFELTAEIPLKAIMRGCRWAVIPTMWSNRSDGATEFRIRKMTRRYLPLIFSMWLEKQRMRKEVRGGRR